MLYNSPGKVCRVADSGAERVAALYGFLCSPGLLPGIASACAILAFPYIWMIVMQIFGMGSWVCSLALLGPPSVREGALCVVNSMPHRLLVIHQLTSDQELLQAAFPADSIALIVHSVLNRNTFLCLGIMNMRLASPPSLQSFFLDLGEVIPSKRRDTLL